MNISMQNPSSSDSSNNKDVTRPPKYQGCTCPIKGNGHHESSCELKFAQVSQPTLETVTQSVPTASVPNISGLAKATVVNVPKISITNEDLMARFVHQIAQIDATGDNVNFLSGTDGENVSMPCAFMFHPTGENKGETRDKSGWFFNPVNKPILKDGGAFYVTQQGGIALNGGFFVDADGNKVVPKDGECFYLALVYGGNLLE